MERIFISLGSNQGHRASYLRKALCRLEDFSSLVQVSRPRRTAAWGKTDQPDFINLAAELRTNLEPDALLQALLQTEISLGRHREEKWGPRTIDLDLLYYGRRLIESPQLTLPHPWIVQRLFILEPLSELAPDWLDVRTGLTIQAMLDSLRTSELNQSEQHPLQKNPPSA